jgi:hypothetical protein
MAERELPKLYTTVRFRSPAPLSLSAAEVPFTRNGFRFHEFGFLELDLPAYLRGSVVR